MNQNRQNLGYKSLPFSKSVDTKSVLPKICGCSCTHASLDPVFLYLIIISGHMSEYQLFVNRKEQICVMQSASEVANGRRIDVYTYSQKKLYDVNLDLCKYGMSRDESICIYTNGAFLAG